MLPKNGHSVEKKYFLYSIIKIYDVNYYLKHRKNIFCNLTIFELVNEIGDFESLWAPQAPHLWQAWVILLKAQGLTRIPFL